MAGLNSRLANSEGWLSEDCENLLYAEILASYTCTNAGTALSLVNTTGTFEQASWQITGPDGYNEILDGSEDAVVFLPVEGEYVVQLSLDNDTESFKAEQIIQVTDNALPNDLEIEVFMDTQLFVDQTAQRFQWYKDGEAIPGATSRLYEPEESGIFYVEAYNSTCRVRSDEYDWVVLSIDNYNNLELLLYPNPASEELTIEDSQLWEAYQVRVTNLQGQVVLRKKLSASASKTTIPIQSLAKGLYILELYYNNGNFSSGRFVKR